MKNVILAAVALSFPMTAAAQADDMERNKATARAFYEDLWFNDRTEAYGDYVADTYVVHDLGDRKGVTEEAVEQKEIADFFHRMGTLTGRMDYQIAEGDKVANRWFMTFEPNDQAKAMGMYGVEGVAIINVFRFNDEGKIVEFWNHRHDPELPQPPQQ
ncbi:MAG: ester cyclase [Parvularcula sp.]|jgi:predicted SnoaL-like aldol condensation-catalyzing enzyme|nr:ester cyclase [Parvularcula sp.]